MKRRKLADDEAAFEKSRHCGTDTGAPGSRADALSNARQRASPNQALIQYGQAMRGYWMAFYRLRRATLYDFVEGRSIE